MDEAKSRDWMNTDRISLITMYTGPRGSLKTLLMTGHMCDQLVRNYYLNKYRGENRRIFSNYPVGFWYKAEDQEKHIYLSPEPLNMEALYVFDKELSDCRVYIDEIDQWMDKQEWYSTTQKLINKVTQLIRKRKMNLHGTIQDFNWLNARLQFQTDLICRCREAAFSPWGKMNHVGLGEMSFLTWIDHSGIMTGYTFKENPHVAVKENIFRSGKKFWNCYNTDYEFDPMESTIKYRIKKKVREISLDGSAAPVDKETNYLSREREDVDSISSSSLQHPSTPYIKMGGDRHAPWLSRMSDVVEQLKSEGKKTVTNSELWDLTKGKLGNAPMNKQEAGIALKQLGVTRCGTGYLQYNLSGYTGKTNHPIITDAEELIRRDDKVAVPRLR